MPGEPTKPEPEPNIILVMAAIVAASFVAKMEDREFQGMQSPRFRACMHKALVVARELYQRSRERG